MNTSIGAAMIAAEACASGSRVPEGSHAMIEFLRSTAILLMGATVLSAGVFVLAYG